MKKSLIEKKLKNFLEVLESKMIKEECRYYYGVTVTGDSDSDFAHIDLIFDKILFKLKIYNIGAKKNVSCIFSIKINKGSIDYPNIVSEINRYVNPNRFQNLTGVLDMFELTVLTYLMTKEACTNADL